MTRMIKCTLEEERDKYKLWFEMKAKAQAQTLVNLAQANLKLEYIKNYLETIGPIYTTKEISMWLIKDD